MSDALWFYHSESTAIALKCIHYAGLVYDAFIAPANVSHALWFKHSESTAIALMCVFYAGTWF